MILLIMAILVEHTELPPLSLHAFILYITAPFQITQSYNHKVVFFADLHFLGHT